ncbi:MAG: aminoacetone oxidase family FAD-binding enzyme [Clostridiales bacterium]|nr:aminoacetone oxidase family FAD-binding enzyme [Clostridiales bacterium]
MVKDLTIIGGGASGMMAGIMAARTLPGIDTVIVERMDRPGRKLLATGNGRCNYTNSNLSINNYHGANPLFARPALEQFNLDNTIRFFRELGVYPRYEAEGKVFPYSGNASAVLDALRLELERLSVPIITNKGISSIEQTKEGFDIIDTENNRFSTRKVLVAAGGKASPALGSDGSGYSLLTSLGHTIKELSPAITHIRTNTKETKALEGIKVTGTVYASNRGKVNSSMDGEVLFTSFGLSGPPVFQFSCLVATNRCDEILIDLMPELQIDAIYSLLSERRTNLSHITMELFFSGLLNKRVGNLVSRRAGIQKLSLPVSDVSDAQLYEMATHIKSLRFSVEGLSTWKHAQVTAGGISTDEFDPETMESLLVPGLYASGEVLDIFGDCGGYNLQWAWSSGYVAGVNSAASLSNPH